MDFSSIQSLGNYTKMLKLRTNWNKKQQNKNYLEKSDEKQRYNPETDPLAPYRKQLDEMRDSRNIAVETLYSKIQSGKKLSPDEMAYLAEKDPASYQKAKEIQMEREAYERKLKQCKTKDEVQRLKMNQVNQSLNTVNLIKNNPNIPEEKKLELIMHEHAKFQAVVETEKRFVESGQYAKLPTDEERNEILKEEQERLEELRGTDETEKDSENVEDGEGTEAAEAGKNLTTDAENSSKPGNPERTEGLEKPGAAKIPEPAKIPETGEKTEVKAPSTTAGTERKNNARHETARQAYRQMMNAEQDIRMENSRRKGGVHKKV